MQEPGVLDVSLTLDALRAAAIDKSGLRDFGDESFFQPLAALLQSLDGEARLSAAGRHGQFSRIVDLLVNRLRVEYWLRQYPQIREEIIAPPVVIVGLMRTGTTMLHRLLACDRRFHALLWYESRYPAPLGDGCDEQREDLRIPLAREEVRQMIAASPDLAAIHPLDACAADEEVMLLEHSFYSTVPESFAYVPGYARWLEEHDNTPGYRYLHTLLQFLQWQKKRRGENAERWLLKTPHHLHHLDILLEVFPGAAIIQTHRDPLQTIPSLCSMNYALASMGSDAVDAHALGQHWCDKFARSLRRAIAVRALQPGRFIDVMYSDTASDPAGTVQRVYDQLGLALGADTLSAMQAWLDDNRREDRDPHHYTLEQFGFTRDQLARDYALYRQHFLP
jgi:hypothetical protein